MLALVLDTVTVDMQRRQVLRGDTLETLTEQECGLLGYLAARPGQTISREELLERVWGYSARAVTRAIDVAVRRLRAKIEADPANPVHVIAVRGVGYRFEPSGQTSAPAKPQSAPPHRLPHARSSFVGRDAEIMQIESLWTAGARLITITGAPGIGKSRLALHAAHQRVARGGSVVHVPLSLARSGPELLRRVAEALDVPLEPGPDAISQLTRALRVRPDLVLLLDDVEHLVEEVASAVGAWLSADGGVRVWATSRERLRLDGENIVQLGALPADDALTLFLERARAVRAGFASSGEREIVCEITRRLDGNPLAMELAAARVEVLTPRTLLAGLDQRLSLLGARDRGRPDRQATLERAIDWSWSLLSPWERSALAQCSVFEGGMSVASAASVLDLSSHTDAPWVLDQVQALVGRSLIGVYDAGVDQVRFQMPESIRAFAKARAIEQGELEPARARHCDHFLALGEAHVERVHGPEGVLYIALLRLEADNLRNALYCALPSEPDKAARLALVLDMLYALSGRASERLSLINAALDAGPSAVLKVRLLIARARPRLLVGDRAGALADSTEASAWSDEIDDPQLRRRVLLVRGEISAEFGDAVLARDFAHRCAEESLAAGDVWFEARALRLVAAVSFSTGDVETQAQVLQRLEVLVAASGDPLLLSNVRHLSARHATASARHELAIARYREALQLALALGDQRHASLIEADLACELALASDLEGALHHFQSTLRCHQSMGHLRSMASSGGNTALILLLLGRLEETLAMFDEAVANARLQGSVGALAPRLAGRGMARLVAGQTALARADLDEALRGYLETERSFAHAQYSAWAALAAAQMGDAEEACVHARSAERLLDDRPTAVFALVARGAAAVAIGERDAARGYLAQAQARAVDGRFVPSAMYWQFVLPGELALAVESLARQCQR